MTVDKTQAHSFVLRVWFERTSSSDQDGEWRGHVTDVASLKRRYFRTVGDLTRFIESIVGEDGPSLFDVSETPGHAPDTSQVETLAAQT